VGGLRRTIIPAWRAAASREFTAGPGRMPNQSSRLCMNPLIVSSRRRSLMGLFHLAFAAAIVRSFLFW
jgi:hypothetical protein